MYNYSGSKCPKCERTFFELAEDAPTDSKYKIYYIRCSSCKTIVGTESYFNTAAVLENLAKSLGVNLRL